MYSFLERFLRTRFKLWRLNQQRKEVQERCDRALAEARKAKGQRLTDDEEYDLYGQFSWEFDVIDWKTSLTITRALLEEANKLLLPTPSHSDQDKWEESGLGEFLSSAGISEVRSAIRREKRERRESWGWWITLVIGLLGTLIGLVAVIKSG